MLPLVSLALASLATPREPAAIAHGSLARPCQWPTVVSFRTSEEKCSATLVHPRVIVTAAHCLEAGSPGRVRFGEQYQPAAFVVDVERCGLDPDYPRTRSPASDVGYCVLAESVEGIPATPLLAGCEAAWLHEGLPAVVVGFGQTERDPGFDAKRYAFTVLAGELRGDGTIMVGDQEVNGCPGDSGGPAFVQSPAGTWHTLGVLAYGPECAQGPSLYRTLADRITWLEAEAGFELSPCHDAAGAWDPAPACGALALDPLALGTSWLDRCTSDLAAAPACPEREATTGAPEALASTTDEPPATDAGADMGCACRTGPGTPLPWLVVLAATRPRRRSPPRDPRPSSPPGRPRHPG